MVWKQLLGKEAVVLKDMEFRILLLANAIVATVSATVSPILDVLTSPFGVSPTEIGLIISIVFVPAVVLIPISGIVARWIGMKPVLIGSLLIFGISGTAIAFTTNFQLVLLFRFLQGIGFAGTIPVIITALGDLYEGEKQTASQGFRFAVSGSSQGIFPILSGFLITISWQVPFFLYTLALPIALLMYFQFEEPDRTKPDVEAAEMANSRYQTISEYLSGLVAVLREPKVALVIIAHALIMAPYISFITYNSIIVIRSIGGTSSHAAILVAMVSFLYATSATQAGRITRTFSSRYLPLTGACFGTGAGLMIFALAPTVTIAVLGVVVLGSTYGITGSLFRSLLVDISPPSLREGIVGCSESLLMTSAVITPIVVGSTVDQFKHTLDIVHALQSILTVTGIGSALLAGSCVLIAHRSPTLTVSHSVEKT